jgi:signal transduction histidine kinase
MKITRLGIARIVIVVALMAAAGASAMAAANDPYPDQGLHLGYQNGQVVIASVDYGSLAQRAGLRPGDIVTRLDNLQVLSEPDMVKREIAAAGGWWWSLDTVPPNEIEAYRLFKAYEASRMVCVGDQWGAVCDSNGDWQPPNGYVPMGGVAELGGYRSIDRAPLFLGLAVLLLGWIWLGSGKAGPALKRVALTLPLAAAMPLLIESFDLHPSLAATVASAVLLPLAMLPLAIDFTTMAAGRWGRWLIGAVVLALAVGSAVVGVLLPANPELRLWRVLLAAGVAFVPGLLAARPLRWRRARGTFGSESATADLVGSAHLVLAAIAPGVCMIGLVSGHSYLIWPFPAWPVVALLLAALTVVGFALWTLAQMGGRAARQRDLVVAATEAERARIAADIHDEALQDLTMLIRRLDAAGDTENGEAAQSIAARLRAICGDLRLPVLDDLGLSPALEWLVGRFERLAGPIRLEVSGEARRLPADVELAVYRVAQEAITNALKHGAPPIIVRYRVEGDAVTLEVDDAGPGLAPKAAELAEAAGRLGLLGMRQRAESIGAELAIGPREAKGTRVTLAWTGPASPVPARADAPEGADSPA